MNLTLDCRFTLMLLDVVMNQFYFFFNFSVFLKFMHLFDTNREAQVHGRLVFTFLAATLSIVYGALLYCLSLSGTITFHLPLASV